MKNATRIIPLVLLLAVLVVPLAAVEKSNVSLSCRQEVESLLAKLKFADTQVRIDSLWNHFAGRPYQGNTLTPAGQPEEFIIKLDIFDCVTWIDHAVALLQAGDWNGFRKNLQLNRYVNSEISYSSRRHFFTDWLERTDWHMPAVFQIEQTEKVLNRRKSNEVWVPGLPCKPRIVHWLPTDSLSSLSTELRSGDLVGFYTDIAGLDVTHVGLLQVKERRIELIHASSAAGELVRVDFLNYVAGKPGVIVLRWRGTGEGE